jgi:hypothetical protein
MTEPMMELIPARGAICSDGEIVLDVLVRITPPLPEVHFHSEPREIAQAIFGGRFRQDPRRT